MYTSNLLPPTNHLSYIYKLESIDEISCHVKNWISSRAIWILKNLDKLK